jgi:succinate dehydrogenase/fumarate reductase flavoprotein subunit
MPPSTTCDVLVVGGGGAGLAAAIEAAERGAEVVLLEKNAALGGSTAWSVGSVTASQTPHQRRAGIEDNPLHHWQDMPGFAGPLASRDNDDLRRVLCEAMPETFAWLLASGIRFMGPMPEPPHRVARMHNVLPNSRAFIYHLSRRAQRAGVRVVTHVHVHALVSERGEVIGVDAQHLGQTQRWLATGGVVLAAGDFTNAADLKARFMGEQAAAIEAVNPTATGDGQRMAEAVGAQIVNGDLALGPEIRFMPPARGHWLLRLPPWRWLASAMAWAIAHVPAVLLRPLMMKFLTTALAPSPELFAQGALLVNTAGQRVDTDSGDPAWSLPQQPGKVGYVLLDHELAKRFSAWPHFVSTAPGVAYAYLDDYRRNRPDVCHVAPNLQALARAIGVPPEALQQVVAHTHMAERTHQPMVALGPVRAVFVHNEGGLRVDAQHRVLNADGQAIAGLYAAGSTGQGGLLLKGHGHHLAWAFTSGRRAGQMAAERARLSA